MSVYSASGTSYPIRRSSPRTRTNETPAARGAGPPASRISRRLAAVNRRAMHRLGQNLGPSWQVVDAPLTGPVSPATDHAGFLAIGPGGIFAVSVVDQGRQRIMVAGDVVQIRGDRPAHVANARRFAKHAASALSAVVGSTVPVVPVLTFVGSGSMSTHGMPVGCLVVSYRELDRLLVSVDNKITPATAQKLAAVAGHPDTWHDHP